LSERVAGGLTKGRRPYALEVRQAQLVYLLNCGAGGHNDIGGRLPNCSTMYNSLATAVSGKRR